MAQPQLHISESGTDLRGTTPAPAVTRWLLLAGIIAPFFFVCAYLVAGAARPGYSLIHQAISDLGVGTHAVLFNACMALTGVLLIAYAVGFGLSMRSVLSSRWRWISAGLLSLHGLGLVIAAIFTEAPATVSIHWLVGAQLGLLGPIFALLTIGLLWRGHREWRAWATFTLVWDLVMLLVLAFTFWAFAPGSSLASAQLGGLMERVALISSEFWFVVVGWYLLVREGRQRRAALVLPGRRTEPTMERAPGMTA
jgi:hypothetical membrane protein